MRLHRWNGERWWVDDKSVARRMCLWVLWPGGWQTFTTWPLRERLHPSKWTPFSMFGHRVTVFGWGIQARAKGGYWVASKSGHPWSVYWSPDGTPSSATVWAFRPPPEVRFAAEAAQREADERLRAATRTREGDAA